MQDISLEFDTLHTEYTELVMLVEHRLVCIISFWIEFCALKSCKLLGDGSYTIWYKGAEKANWQNEGGQAWNKKTGETDEHGFESSNCAQIVDEWDS